MSGGRMGQLSLCTGIGGLELAFPGQLLAYAETDPAPSQVMARLAPAAPNLGDIRTLDTARLAGYPADEILAGIPCQGVSEQGRKLGAADPRWLGPDFLRVVAAVRPGSVFLENVEGILFPHKAAELAQILDGLAGLGYSVRYGTVGACAIGAPHCRHRFYLDALLSSPGEVRRASIDVCGARDVPALLPSPRAGDGIRGAELQRAKRTGTGGTLADAVALGYVDPGTWQQYEKALARWEYLSGELMPQPWEPARTQSGVRLAADFSRWLMGLPAGHLAGLRRGDALRCAGNAVVPQAAAYARQILRERR